MSEVIEGETIIIDMQTGTYFSTDGLGSALWAAAVAGQGRQALVDGASKAYPAAAEAGADTVAFLDALVAAGLLVETPGAAGMGDVAWPAGEYAKPQLHQHSDMQDLIMLDPIHEVDNVGWPKRREDMHPPAAA
ncbi:MAG: PqqD family peptide modification chaperone [Rickettsiales bacterium]|nr:PqqD family peptide modification chaperone [Rickettsiales bacterium]